MSNQAVTLLVVGKTEKGWRRLPVAFGRNGKIRPKHAQIGDQQVHLPGSYYALRYFEGSKTVCALHHCRRPGQRTDRGSR
jgi:hypothetical protein